MTDNRYRWSRVQPEASRRRLGPRAKDGRAPQSPGSRTAGRRQAARRPQRRPRPSQDRDHQRRFVSNNFRIRFYSGGDLTSESKELAAYAFAVANSKPTLRPAGSSPAGMVWVPGGRADIAGKSVEYAGFWLDKFEVTNREFKKFVDAGGYRKRDHWKQPFLKDAREVSWEDGIRGLVDKTGRPGPSTWALGTYADGEEEYPVQPPFDRSEIYGFRCARYEGEVAEALRDPIQRIWRDYAREKPVDDAAFRLIESIDAYDRTELKPETQPLESGSAHWRLEKASFQAAYGNERVIVYLYLPKSAAPPCQAVLYFPGSGAEAVASHDWDLTNLDFVIKRGRVVLVPVYNGLYERRFPTPLPGRRQSRARRDLIIQWHKDMSRSIDYPESRKDIDSQKLAFYGISLGARMGVIFTAFEKRIKASILLAGGLDAVEIPPEVDETNSLSRIKVPTMMLNGRDDFRSPLLVSQKPMFQLLGPPEGHKRHGLISGGHIPSKIEIIKEGLDWLDRYLGPVAAPGPPVAP